MPAAAGAVPQLQDEGKNVSLVSVSLLRRWGAAALRTCCLGGLLLLAASVLEVGEANAAPVTLTQDERTFRITAVVRAMPVGSLASPRCEGPAALLVPGVSRCLVFQVQNTLERPIEVRTITMGLDPAFPPPPSGCSAEKLLLPSFSGVLTVPAKGKGETPGLPIQLKNTPSNQDDCQQKLLNFTFSGTASYAGPENPGLDPHMPATGSTVSGLLLGGGVLALTGLLLLAASRRRRARSSS